MQTVQIKPGSLTGLNKSVKVAQTSHPKALGPSRFRVSQPGRQIPGIHFCLAGQPRPASPVYIKIKKTDPSNKTAPNPQEPINKIIPEINTLG